MNKIILRTGLIIAFLFLSLNAHAGFVKGIYLTQNTLENTAYVNSLIKQAKAVGIDTFIVDIERPNDRYRKNISLLKQSGIKYVARVVIFPGGGTREQVQSPAIWQKKYPLVQFAIDSGANEIQLDYIRYNTKQRAIAQNAKDIKRIIDWYKAKVAKQGIPLQIDVFGETSRGPSLRIGQDIEVFASSVNAICPMVYPSHYEPAKYHSRRPYTTVYTAIDEIHGMFNGRPPFKIYTYIELSNYRYPMSRAQKLKYIDAQIQASIDAKANGWYAWSPHNRYENLFTVLKNRMTNPPSRQAYNEPGVARSAATTARPARSNAPARQNTYSGKVVHMY